MNESELKDVLQDAARRQDGASVPDFDTVWVAAEARHARQRKQRFVLGGAAAAAALVLAVLVSIGPDIGPSQPADEYLIADALMNSTQWRAPSDALLPQYRDDIYSEIPLLMESTNMEEGSLL